jgi:hypothetical protein
VSAYHRARQCLRRRSAFRPALTRVRHLLLAGPLAPALVGYHRTVSRAPPIETNNLPHLEPFSIDQAVTSLRVSGFAAGVRVTPACVEQLLACYDSNPLARYDRPHADHRLIREIAHHESLVAVARSYLGAMPIFLNSRLFEYAAGLAPPDCFHFDVDDVLSLTFFVFLSEVNDERGGSHEVVAGTHRTKSVGEIWTRRLDATDARARYANRIHRLVGAPGTAWFEDTRAYHRRGRVELPRRALSLQYSLCRRAL